MVLNPPYLVALSGLVGVVDDPEVHLPVEFFPYLVPNEVLWVGKCCLVELYRIEFRKCCEFHSAVGVEDDLVVVQSDHPLRNAFEYAFA